MPASFYTCLAILTAAVTCWSRFVTQEVPQPYLDEVFHVPQAQHYCAGDWTRWDAKITTPPGLYLIAASLSPLLGCSTTTLRVENAACIVILFPVLVNLLSNHGHSNITPRQLGISAAHAALNIVLFPPLFFFSALYYTDVPSTLSVLVFYLTWDRSRHDKRRPASTAGVLYVLGIWSLLFRQTNIFWVAIFPAALTVVSHLDQGHAVVKKSMYSGTSGFGDSLVSVVKTSWKMRVVYDRGVEDALFADYLKCILSNVTGILRLVTDMPLTRRLIVALSPFLGLLATFAAFILLNGSVVLGDKSNHVATLHLPQMLYIWPYLLFFSWPVVLTRIIDVSTTVLARIPLLSRLPVHQRKHSLPRIRYLVVFAVLAGPMIRYNTIVHPFTLADNRHYTFYVFRLLMRPSWMRHAVVPIYALSAWLCIQALGGTEAAPAIKDDTAHTDANADAAAAAAATASTATATAGTSTTTSTVLAWLVTSALQLVTAPLVEPRYFILPWIFWRLRVQPHRDVSAKPHGKTILQTALQPQHEQCLWLETIWYLSINVVTGYIFLNWPFTWLSEPGNNQRFMW